MIHFNIDCNIKKTFPHYWEECVGSCHAYTALREDYRKQLRKAHRELGFKYVRFHGLFDDDMSVCVQKITFTGEPLGIVYNFVNVDNIIDFFLEIGMKPFLELGFMPSCLASGEKTVFHYKGNITMPAKDEQWCDLVREFIHHLISRYGSEEVRQWFFEVWNEPNLAFFFDGTQQDYFHLYEMTAKTIKSVDSQLKVGGPSTSFNSWISEMIEFCEKNQVPLDFVSTHHYPTDDPLWQSGMDIDEFFKSDLIKSGKGHIYERGTLQKMTLYTRERAGKYPLYYTEWNTSGQTNDSQHDEPYAAAMVAKTLADNDGLVEGYSYWTFTDIFEENAQLKGFYHGGFGLQTVAGIEKPTYRLFELMHRLGNTRLKVESSDDNSTVGLLATETENKLHLIAYNHHVIGESITEEKIEITIANNDKKIKEIKMYRIDEEHANAKVEWVKMGEPEYPGKKEIARLHHYSALQEEKIKELKLIIPAHGVVGIDVVF